MSRTPRLVCVAHAVRCIAFCIARAIRYRFLPTDLQGIPGMILAVPMVVITRIVCDHLDHPYAKTLMSLLEGNVFEVRFVSCPPRNRARGWG